MDEIFAFCPNPGCGAVITPNIRINGPSGARGNVTIKMVGANTTCPKCGARVPINDGTYLSDGGSADAALKFIDGPIQSRLLIEEAKRLLGFLEKGTASKDEVIAAVEKVSPALGLISRQEAGTTNYKEWINMLVGLLALFISIQQGFFKKDDSSDIKREYIEHLLKENEQLKKTEAAHKIVPITRKPIPAKAKPKVKVGRNSLCPCGSGKKNKHCHGYK